MDAPRIRGLNHLTLAVRDLARSIAFYCDLLGCDLRAHWKTGAYLETDTLWLCLSLDEAARQKPHPDYTHIAFDVAEDQFERLSTRIQAVAPIWKTNTSEGNSLYFLDPDGHKLEIHTGSLASRLAHYRANASSDITIL